MKRGIKILLYAISIVLFIALLSGVALVYYLETGINKVMSVSNQEHLCSQISKSEPLPSNIYHTLDKFYPEYFETGVWRALWLEVTNSRRNQCQCLEIYLPGLTDHSVKFSRIIVALFIQNKFTQRKCFEFYMSTSDFGCNARNIKQAAALYYGKKLDELNEREILALNLVVRSPTLLNPKINPENLKLAIDNITSGTRP